MPHCYGNTIWLCGCIYNVYTATQPLIHEYLAVWCMCWNCMTRFLSICRWKRWIAQQNVILLFDNVIEGRSLGALRLLLGPWKASLWERRVSPIPRLPFEGVQEQGWEGERGGLGGWGSCFWYHNSLPTASYDIWPSHSKMVPPMRVFKNQTVSKFHWNWLFTCIVQVS